MFWLQKELILPPHRRGFHLITPVILAGVPDLRRVRVGLLHLFMQHTSASLTLNENADPDVQVDLEMASSRIVPESFPYTHTLEGRDDMPAHVKCSMLGCSLTLPVTDGRPRLGIWQGIYLCEHRDQAGPRHVVLTAFGAEEQEQLVRCLNRAGSFPRAALLGSVSSPFPLGSSVAANATYPGETH